MTDKKFSYEELDQIIRGYKSGDKSYGPRLYDAFKGFIGRYVDILHRGRYKISDRLTREFIALYMQDEEKRRHIHQYNHMPAVRHEIYKVSDNLRFIFTPFSPEELENELVIALFQLANRYRFYDDKPRFHTYVRRTFAYEAKRRIESLMIDPTAYRFDDRVDEGQDGGYDESISAIEYALKISTHQHELLEDEFENVLNENWINGITCAEPFQTLSKLERRILKLYYQEEYTDQKIADIIGCCRATINRRRLVAEEKVKDAVRKGCSL